MATIPGAALDAGLTSPGSGPGPAAFVDRWKFVFTAALIFAVVLIGFVPDSVRLVAAVEAGTAAPFPPVLHVHAVLMGAWISLLLIQATLMAMRRPIGHMQLGIASFLLAPAILIAGFLLIPVRRGQLAEIIANAPPAIAMQLQTEVVPFVNNIMLLQIRVGILFAILVALALYFRRRDPATHKRLMILATIVPLPAATDRMTWLPHTFPESPLTAELYPMLVVAPLFLWDLYRRGGVQRAYWIWLALTLPAAILTYSLWGTPAWQDLVGPIGGLG